MRISLFLRLFLSLSLWTACPYVLYAHHELPFPVLVMPSEPITGTDLPWDYLFDGQPFSIPTDVRAFGPFHGDLIPTSDGFYYVARPSLWQAKIDSFVLDYQQDGDRRTKNVALVVGSAHHRDSRQNSFDLPLGDFWGSEDPSGAMVLNQRLWIPSWVVDDTFVFASSIGLVTDQPWDDDVYENVRTHAGSTTTGLGGGVLLDPPPDPGFFAKGLGVAAGNAPGHVFFAAGKSADTSSVFVQGYLELDGDHRRARVEAFDEDGNVYQSPPVDLPTDRQILLEVESDDSEHGMEVARLLIDGVRVAHTPDFEAGHRVEELQEHRFGVLQIAAAGAAELSIDTAEVYYYRVHGEEEPRHTDHFELLEPLALRWTEEHGGGLSVVTRDDVGRRWLLAEVGKGDSYVVDATPEAESWARLRFDMDPSELDGLAVEVLTAYDFDQPTDNGKHLRVLARHHDIEGPQIRAGIKDTIWRYTDWHPLAKDRPSQIDLTFKQASFAATDGELQLRVDGLLLDSVRNLINWSRSVDSVHFGAVGTHPSGTGNLWLDNYQIWVPHGEEP